MAEANRMTGALLREAIPQLAAEFPQCQEAFDMLLGDVDLCDRFAALLDAVYAKTGDLTQASVLRELGAA